MSGLQGGTYDADSRCSTQDARLSRQTPKEKMIWDLQYGSSSGKLIDHLPVGTVTTVKIHAQGVGLKGRNFSAEQRQP